MPTTTEELEQLADAYVTALNAAATAGTFGTSFTAYRTYDLVKDVKQLATLDVLVIPAEEDETDLLRGGVQLDLTIDVGVRIHVANKANATIDPYAKLVGLIRDWSRRLKLTTAGGLICTNISRKITAPWDPEELKQTCVFLSPIRLVFRTVKGV